MSAQLPDQASPIRRLLALCTGACALLLLAAGQAVAQAGTTTGAISVRTVSAEERPLANVQVIATNQETGFERSALTNREGMSTLFLLPPGVYTVRARMLGFATEEVSDVRVALGQTAAVRFTMRDDAIAIEGVEVTAGQQRIDVRDPSTRQTVSQDEIENLPAPDRDFTQLLALSGAVSPTPESTTGGQFSIGGQRPSQTNLQIDGVDANNAFFGENRGGSRAPFTFSIESIREFQIITNGYDVEYGNYSGGVVNVVTRGGTNRLEGNAYANYRSDAFTKDDFAGQPVDDYEVMQFAARVSGPIIENRVFYLFSADAQRRREPRLGLSAAEFYDEAGELVNPGGLADFNRFLSILENQYGITNAPSLYAPFSTTNDAITLFGRVDWTLSDAHRLSLRHNYATYTNENQGSPFAYGVTRGETFESSSHSFVTELQSVLGTNTFNTLRFQAAWEDRPRVPFDQRPGLLVQRSGADFGYGGTSVGFNNLMEESKIQLVNNLTHAMGAHTFKVGFNLIGTRIFNRFIAQGAGQYMFSSLDAFEEFRPSLYTRNQRPDGRMPESEFDVFEWSIYGQDEWQLTPRLLVSGGLRLDQQIFAQQPARVLDVERAFNYETGSAPSGFNFSPRLAATYDLFGTGNSVVRGGVGLFSGRVPYVLGANVAQRDLPLLSLSCPGNLQEGDANAPRAPTGFASWDRGGADNPTGCLAGAVLAGLPEYEVWQTDFEYPETFKASLGYEQLLGQAARVGLDLSFTDSRKLYTVRNLNLREAQFELASEGGRHIFTPRDQFNPANAGSTAHRVNTDFSNVFVIFNDGVARSFTASLTGSYDFSRSTRVRAEYAFNSAYDNSSFSCCTSFAGYTQPSLGMSGPNDLGGVGDTHKSWGPSDFVRPHTFIASGTTLAPLGIRFDAFWRWEAGRRWTPEQAQRLAGHGVAFTDRPFIFSPQDLPLATTDPVVDTEQRLRYAQFLADNPCVGDYVGQIIPRNTCQNPAFNRLDMKVSRAFGVTGTHRIRVELDLFNVLNGLNSDWGRYEAVTTNRRNLINPVGFRPGADPADDTIVYEVTPLPFGETRQFLGLTQQFQAQLAVRYSF